MQTGNLNLKRKVIVEFAGFYLLSVVLLICLTLGNKLSKFTRHCDTVSIFQAVKLLHCVNKVKLYSWLSSNHHLEYATDPIVIYSYSLFKMLPLSCLTD